MRPPFRAHTHASVRAGHACVMEVCVVTAADSCRRSASRSAHEILAKPLVLSQSQASQCLKRRWRSSSSPAAPTCRPSARVDLGSLTGRRHSADNLEVWILSAPRRRESLPAIPPRAWLATSRLVASSSLAASRPQFLSRRLPRPFQSIQLRRPSRACPHRCLQFQSLRSPFQSATLRPRPMTLRRPCWLHLLLSAALDHSPSGPVLPYRRRPSRSRE
jgi:hypothetical protein